MNDRVFVRVRQGFPGDDGRPHHVPHARACPACGRSATAAANAAPGERQRPKRGDWSVCGYCGALNVYGPKLGLRAATDAERAEFEAEVDEPTKARIAEARERFGRDQ